MFSLDKSLNVEVGRSVDALGPSLDLCWDAPFLDAFMTSTSEKQSQVS